MNIIEINKLNSLVELFFKKFEEIDKDKPFLKWLKSDNPIYSWNDIAEMIFKLTDKIESLIQKGDRCIILSENRPYWLMSDIAIMNAGGVSVPIFTTYSTKDYEYILKDCKPSIIIVSNNFLSILIIARRIISDADPCIGALIAARSWKFLTLKFLSLIPLK